MCIPLALEEKEAILLKLEKLKLETDIRSFQEMSVVEERDRLAKLVREAKNNRTRLHKEISSREQSLRKSKHALANANIKNEALVTEVECNQKQYDSLSRQNQELYSAVKKLRAELGDDTMRHAYVYCNVI